MKTFVRFSVALALLLSSVTVAAGNAAASGFLLLYSNDVRGETEPCG